LIIRKISERRRKARKTRRKILKWAIITSRLVLVLLVIFLAILLVKFALSKFIPARSTSVVEAHFTEVPFTISCRGLIFRKEKIFTAGLEGVLHQIATDGQKVKKGDIVAKVYNYELETTLKKRRMDIRQNGVKLQLSRFRHITRWKIKDGTLVFSLNKKIDKLRENLLNFKLDDSRLIEKEIEEIVLKRQELKEEHRKYRMEMSNKIDMLDKENGNIINTLQKNVSLNFTAEYDGVVSYYFDGYEEKLSPESILKSPLWETPKIELSPMKIRNGQKVGVGSQVFKLIELPYFILTRVSSDNKDYLETREDRVIMFPEYHTQIAGSVEKVYDKGFQSSDLLVVLSSKQLENPLLIKREVSMEILLSKVNGVSLPKSSKVEKNGESGVYIVDQSRKAKFFPVRVKVEDGNQFIVEGLKDGAIVIVDARDIKEGMAVTVKQ